MDIVKKTDPSTVTQHGLYMRPLTDPSLHPLVAKAPPAEAPDTPPNEEEPKTVSLAASNSPDTAGAATVKELAKHSEDCRQPPAQETTRAGAEPTSPLSAPTSAEVKDPSVPAGNSSVLNGNSTSSVGTASTAVKAPSTTEGSPNAKASDSKTGSDAVPGQQTETPADGHEGWGRGRVSLLGDAAHATIPNGVRWLFSERNNACGVMQGAMSAAYHHTCIHAAKPLLLHLLPTKAMLMHQELLI